MSEMESVDEILDWYEWSLDRTKEENIERIKEMKAALTRREERIKVEAELRAVNNNLNGWASYWSVNLGWEKFEQFMTNYKAELEQQLKALDEQEKV